VSRLEIYKSSAGSGKTTALAREYISLLYPYVHHFEHILAVTFTNKATEEIKERILLYLHRLRTYLPDDRPTPIKLIYDDIEPRLRKQYPNESERLQAIHSWARQALVGILHAYDRFAVSTIDSFFQRILRAFLRELDLSYNFNIEMDQDAVLEKSVRQLFQTAERKPDLRDHLARFLSDKINEKGTWRIEANLENIAKELFSDQNKLFSRAEALTPENFSAYQHQVQQIITAFQDQMTAYADAWFTALHRYGLQTEDFSGKDKSFANFFNKIRNGQYETTETLIKTYAGEKEWVAQKSPNKEKILKAKDEALGEILRQSVGYFIENEANYRFALAVKKHQFSHAVLNDLHKTLEDYLRFNDLMLISQTGEKISEIIAGSDVPFIYEKIGNKYRHFLLDEFQDTATEQWQNLLPLIRNSLADGHYSMIVGDVKQAIYRWRGGNIDLLLHQVKDDLASVGEDIATRNLDSNHRSALNIIKFNNTLFGTLVRWAKESGSLEHGAGDYLADVYADSSQRFPAYKENQADAQGCVRVEFLPETIKGEDRTLNLIQSLCQRGYEYRHIAILVRDKKKGYIVAEKLMGCGIPVISDESLQVSQHGVVRLLVATMRFLLQSEDSVAVMEAVQNYRTTVKRQPLSTNDWQIITTLPREGDRLSATELAKAFLPEKVAFDTAYLARLPLPEIVEELIRRYELQSFANAYVLGFMDLVLEFLTKQYGNGHLSGFLRWWDEKGHQKTITLSEKENAVRIMTIHKAKGLEFPVVILPYTDWTLEPETQNNKAPKLWIKPPAEWNNLPDDFRLPVDYNKEWLKDRYRQLPVHAQAVAEKKHALADNVNLLYVALTRPVRELWVFADRPKEKEKTVTTVGALLHELLTTEAVVPIHTTVPEADQRLYLSFDAMQVQADASESPLVWQAGEMMPYHPKKQEHQGETLVPTELKVLESLPSLAWRSRMVIKPTVAATQDLSSLMRQAGYRTFPVQQVLIRMGNVPHTEEEWQALVQPLAFEGIIRHSEISEVITQVQAVLAYAPDYFTEAWQLISDKHILSPDSADGYAPHRLLFRDERYVAMDFRTVTQDESTTRLRQYGKSLQTLTGMAVDLREVYVSPPYAVREVKHRK
jgi:ATP-dependent exoDNAse (exonuclease V) beta subunit